MTESQAQTPAQRMIGDFAPKLVSLTDDVLFGDVWARPELSPRDRSLITVAGLISGGNTEQLSGHLQRAKGQRADRDRTQGGHHPHGVLCRLAESNVGHDGCQADFHRLKGSRWEPLGSRGTCRIGERRVGVGSPALTADLRLEVPPRECCRTVGTSRGR